MPKVLELQRHTFVPPAADGVFKAGADVADITPALGTFLAGWGPGTSARRAKQYVSALKARVLVVDDGQGSRVALIAADLHAGTRYLSEKVAALTADLHLHVGSIVLCGSHNHAGPANLYASPYSDAFVGSFPWVRGFHQPLADSLAQRIAGAVRRACAALRPARLGHASVPVWGWSVNRSLQAFLRNFPGQLPLMVAATLAMRNQAPADVTDLERLAIDPRVQVLAATGTDGLPIGAFCTTGVHCALLDRDHAALGADFFGVAQREAERLLVKSGASPVIGLGAAAQGDQDPRPPGMKLDELLAARSRSLMRNLELVEAHGVRLGKAIAEAFVLAEQNPPLGRITVRFDEPKIQAAPATRRTDGQEVFTSRQAMIGSSTLAGSELGTGPGSEGNVVPSPDDPNDPDHAQWPKPFALPKLKRFLEPLKYQRLTIPLRFISFDDVALLGVPGEPTMWLASELARLLEADGGHRVMVAGVCGDYSGYFTTEAEYLAQHYEGSSTLWGRNTQWWLEHHYRRLGKEAASAAPTGLARFTVEDYAEGMPLLAAQQTATISLGAESSVIGTRFSIQGMAPSGVHAAPAEDWVRLDAGAQISLPPWRALLELVEDHTHGSFFGWRVELEQWTALKGKSLTLTLTLNGQTQTHIVNVPA